MKPMVKLFVYRGCTCTDRVVKLFPPVKSVVDTYKHKLPKDDLKRFAKQVRVHSQLSYQESHPNGLRRLRRSL